MRKAIINFVMSVPPHGIIRLPLGGFLWNLIFENLFLNLSRKFKCHYNRTRIKGTLHENRYTFLIISLSVLLRMRNASEKCCRENQSTHFVFNNVFFFENHGVYEIMWKNTVELGRSHDNMAHAHCMLDNWGYKYTHSGCVIIIALPLQQWLHKRASLLRCTYAACLVLC